MLWFLSEYVLDREIRTSPYKKARLALQTDDSSPSLVRQTLGSGSIDVYVAAILNLYKQQHSLGNNTNPHPRGVKLKAVLETRAKKEAVRRKSQYEDRAAGTLIDGYRPEHIERFVRACWQQWSVRKGVNRQTVESLLRTGADFLMAHCMLLRGECRRTIQFPDLFSIELENEGPTPCHALIVILRNGKTNQCGRLEYGVAVRHKNLFSCPLSQLAFYLFFRWNIVREPPPHFQRRQNWYDLHLFRANVQHDQISYKCQLDWTNKIFDYINLSSLKKKPTPDVKMGPNKPN